MAKKSESLITGGAGFIGSNLADKLLNSGTKVICYDNFNSYYFGKERNIEKNLDNSNYRLVKGDILDLKSLSETAKEAEIIYHLAAQPGVRYSIQNPVEVSHININGTINVLEAMRLADVKRLVFASSSSVYGKPQHLPIQETHPTDPISPYGASKLAAEKYCELYGELYGFSISILRYFTAYGPRQRPDMAIHKFVKTILADQNPIIYGDGAQTRDFTYIDDIVQSTVLAAEKMMSGVHIFNIGGGQRISINDLIQRLISLCGKKDNIMPIYESKMFGDMSDTHADIGMASRLLGYKPITSLKEGLNNFIDWYNSSFKQL